MITALKSLWGTRGRLVLPVSRTLQYGERSIPYWLHRGNGRRLRLMVKPNLEVRVSAPRRASERDIVAAVQAKAPWIVKQLDRMKEFHPLPAPRQYVSGETFLYMGRQYRLRVTQGMKSVTLDSESLCVTIPDPSDSAAVERWVSAWYRERAMTCFGYRLLAIRDLASQHGIPFAQFRVRVMRTRWGSCSRAGKITLNVALVEMPVQCIDYVIMHELCHLVHHNHSRAFYGLLTRCMPDWKERKNLLTLCAIIKCYREKETGLGADAP